MTELAKSGEDDRGKVNKRMLPDKSQVDVSIGRDTTQARFDTIRYAQSLLAIAADSTYKSLNKRHDNRADLTPDSQDSHGAHISIGEDTFGGQTFLSIGLTEEYDPESQSAGGDEFHLYFPMAEGFSYSPDEMGATSVMDKIDGGTIYTVHLHREQGAVSARLARLSYGGADVQAGIRLNDVPDLFGAANIYKGLLARFIYEHKDAKPSIEPNKTGAVSSETSRIMGSYALYPLKVIEGDHGTSTATDV